MKKNIYGNKNYKKKKECGVQYFVVVFIIILKDFLFQYLSFCVHRRKQKSFF